jgi:ATP-dependent Lon protease
MAITPVSPRSLPEKPNAEHLRKQAKRLARDDAMQLAAAQRQLARQYGYRDWAALMTAVETMAAPHGGDSGANNSQPEGTSRERESAQNLFPFLPLRGLVAFPHVSYQIFLGRPNSIKAAAHAYEHSIPVLLVTQRDQQVSDPTSSDMYHVGTIATLVETLRLPDGTIKSVVEGKGRARIGRFIFNEEFFQAEAEAVPEPVIYDSRLVSATRSLLSALLRDRLTVAPGANKPEAFAVPATTTDDVRVLADRMASELRADLASKQELLEILDPVERLEKLLAYLNALG